MDGREPGARHQLRPDRSLPLCAVGPVLLSVAVAAAIEPGHPQHRIAAVAGVLLAVSVAWGPFEGTGRSPFWRALAVSSGICLAPVVCALIHGTGHDGAISTGLVVAGFFILLCGLAVFTTAVLRSPALAMILVGTFGAMAISSFHLGDPFLEWGGAGRPSHFAMSVLQWVNPLSGAVGDGHGIDWLRLPIMYSGFPGSTGGGLSAAQYYDFAYPPSWIQGPAFALVGTALMVLPVRSAFRFPPGAPAA